MFRKAPQFLENSLLNERTVFEKGGTHQDQAEGLGRTEGEVRKLP